ncbi:hypothetical protein [Novosphingobium sp. JCM 18896]|uniref:hypothetical protein n=1 Tax=Novosphingobium sp. JCM 18896 TaxID=2989731 RepID=UPI002221549D|nr:hypothetical protein [Novosphingobium sp. JCM 18896]MCW1430399.1 hypothetical protein [Novosphingobium sp. JCM 18896]
MPKQDSIRAWNIDFANGLATCGGVVIRFSRCIENGTRVAFVEGANDSLERQCELAGEALAAIERTHRRTGTW